MEHYSGIDVRMEAHPGLHPQLHAAIATFPNPLILVLFKFSLVPLVLLLIIHGDDLSTLDEQVLRKN
jgi:hypothetical protein